VLHASGLDTSFGQSLESVALVACRSRLPCRLVLQSSIIVSTRKAYSLFSFASVLLCMTFRRKQ